MNNTTQFKKAFTLLEVLIATSIFAVVMVMTTGVIAQSTSYQTKTKALRDASEEAGRISDAIARDLKTATGSFKVVDIIPTTKEFKNSVALVDVSYTFIGSTAPANTSTTMTSASYPAVAVIINTSDSIKIYVNTNIGTQNIVYAETFSKTDLTSGSLTAGGWWNGNTNTLNLKSTISSANLITTKITNASANIISSSNGTDALDTQIAFSGYTAVTGGQNVQSYITYFVHSMTKDFTSLVPTNRSESYVRSMVTMRNYSN